MLRLFSLAPSLFPGHTLSQIFFSVLRSPCSKGPFELRKTAGADYQSAITLYPPKSSRKYENPIYTPLVSSKEPLPPPSGVHYTSTFGIIEIIASR